MLDAVGAVLAAEGVSHVRIDGSMTAGKRAAAIAAFSETGADTPRVALVSLKAGGVGLNLTAASQARSTALRKQPEKRMLQIGPDTYELACDDCSIPMQTAVDVARHNVLLRGHGSRRIQRLVSGARRAGNMLPRRGLG